MKPAGGGALLRVCLPGRRTRQLLPRRARRRFSPNPNHFEGGPPLHHRLPKDRGFLLLVWGQRRTYVFLPQADGTLWRARLSIFGNKRGLGVRS